MNNSQNATWAKTPDGLFLVQIPPARHVNPTTVMSLFAPNASPACDALTRHATHFYDNVSQMKHKIVGMERF
jgi:hypothetical protein